MLLSATEGGNSLQPGESRYTVSSFGIKRVGRCVGGRGWIVVVAGPELSPLPFFECDSGKLTDSRIGRSSIMLH